MNTYRVHFRKNGGGRVARFDVDAALPSIAINRALKNLELGVRSLDVSVHLVASDIVRKISDPKVRAA